MENIKNHKSIRARTHKIEKIHFLPSFDPHFSNIWRKWKRWTECIQKGYSWYIYGIIIEIVSNRSFKYIDIFSFCLEEYSKNLNASRIAGNLTNLHSHLLYLLILLLVFLGIIWIINPFHPVIQIYLQVIRSQCVAVTSRKYVHFLCLMFKFKFTSKVI